MINLNLTNRQAIQVYGLLKSMPILASKTLPDYAKRQLAEGFENDSDLRHVAEQLKVELDILVSLQTSDWEEDVM